MNTKSRYSPRLVHPAILAGAVLMLLLAWPAPSPAQTTLRVPQTAIQAPPTTFQIPPTAIQVPPTTFQIPPITVQIPDLQCFEVAQKSFDALRPSIDALKIYEQALGRLNTLSFEPMASPLAELQVSGQGVGVVQGRGFAGTFGISESSLYESGLSALDSEQWQRAADLFDRVVKAAKTHVDGAMYWKAYALDRLGARADALSVLQELMKSYPNSRYLEDAKALEIEVRQRAGQPVRPEEHANEDLKLLAMNSLMQTDPERAIPLLQQVLKERNSPKVKQRALFVLAQSSSPKAQEVVAQIARGAGNPDLQMKAVRYLGTYGRSNTQLLADIYASSKDVDVKREIIRSLATARDIDRLLEIAKTESSPELRTEVIRQLGMMRADSQLFQLYSAEKTADVREQIFRSMAMTGNAERMAEIARQDADAKLRASAVRSLGTMDSKKTGDILVQIYKTDKDPGVKKQVVSTLYMQQNAKALVDLARQETDPAMKKEIVSRLSTMKSKEAIDYLLELLK